jgi:hypothetical protein
MSTSVLDQLFGPGSPADQAIMLEAFKSAMVDALDEHDRGDLRVDFSSPAVHTHVITKGLNRRAGQLARLDKITKGLGTDLGDFGEELAALRADLAKDWTPTSPVSSGLVPYDLEGPAKVLVPLNTPLRNTIPRVKGQGNARQYKRITSFSNAGIPGGAANQSPFFSSLSTTSTWGPTGNVTLARPAKITYTGDSLSVGYVELGMSDSVDWISQFEGLGFDDLRALSHTALLFAHMMGEERADLYGRGSGTGYAGAVSAPTVAVVGSDSGGALATATYFVYVAAVTGFGQSAVSTVQSSGARTGPSASVAVTVATEPTGALYYALYVGTVTGIANAHFQTYFTGNVYTLTTYNAAGAVIAGTDSSADANAYDGFLTVLTGANSGYFLRANAPFSTTNPGAEFDLALATMYTNNGADPDEIWLPGALRSSLAQSMRKAAGSGYRTTLVTGDSGVTMGTVVTGIQNNNTGKIVDVRTHRFMPQGAALIRSTSLPIPNSHVEAPAVKVNVQDYFAVDWPVIQMTYDASTYQIGTLVHYAPAWSGAIVGITG